MTDEQQSQAGWIGCQDDRAISEQRRSLFYGALAGLLTGAADPPRRLTRAAQQLGDDEVLLMVNLNRRTGPPLERITTTLQAHGGRV